MLPATSMMPHHLTSTNGSAINWSSNCGSFHLKAAVHSFTAVTDASRGSFSKSASCCLSQPIRSSTSWKTSYHQIPSQRWIANHAGAGLKGTSLFYSYWRCWIGSCQRGFQGTNASNWSSTINSKSSSLMILPITDPRHSLPETESSSKIASSI